MRRWFYALAVYDDRLDALAKVTAPSMVIAFERDITMPAVEGHRVADAIPRCSYVEIPGAVHDGMWTHSDVVMDHVIEFFGSA